MKLFKHRSNLKDDVIPYKKVDIRVPFDLICEDISEICSAANKILSSTHRSLYKADKVKKKNSHQSKPCSKLKVKSQLSFDAAKEQLLKFILVSVSRELRGIRAYSLLSCADNSDFIERIEEMLSKLNSLLTHSRLKDVIPKNTSRYIARTARTSLRYVKLESDLMQLKIHCYEWLSLLKTNNDFYETNIDWSSYDVLVGSFGSKEQFEDNLARKYYYAPAAFIKENKMPVKYIALYQSKKFSDAGIRYYGKISYVKKMKRKKIPFPMRRPNGNEDYYLFAVDEWKQLPRSIRIRNEGVFEPNFTSMFLLKNSVYSYELFNIRSAEQFEVLRALRELFIQTYIYSNKEYMRYELSNGISIESYNGALSLIDKKGTSISERPLYLSSFVKQPKNSFNTLCKYLNIK